MPDVSTVNAKFYTTIQVLQGEYRVSSDRGTLLSTILGSCVATCIWDPVAGIGGMNHVLLPGTRRQDEKSLLRGVNLMEQLLNSLLQMGAHRERLQAKVFGGAKMLYGSSRVGDANARFALWFLENEGIPCVSKCVGGTLGRRVRFWPATGRAQRLLMRDPEQVRALLPGEPLSEEVPAPPGNADPEADVTLF